jgi:hypothetical protein
MTESTEASETSFMPASYPELETLGGFSHRPLKDPQRLSSGALRVVAQLAALD